MEGQGRSRKVMDGVSPGPTVTFPLDFRFRIWDLDLDLGLDLGLTIIHNIVKININMLIRRGDDINNDRDNHQEG